MILLVILAPETLVPLGQLAEPESDKNKTQPPLNTTAPVKSVSKSFNSIQHNDIYRYNQRRCHPSKITTILIVIPTIRSSPVRHWRTCTMRWSLG